MQVSTSRFGRITCGTKHLLLCPDGLIGFEDLRLWAVLQEGNVVWLQSVEQAEIALPTVSPFSYVPEYEPHFSAHEFGQETEPCEQPLLLAVLSQHGSDWTLNLRAPIVVQLLQRVARQVITTNEQPLRYVLSRMHGTRRKIA